MSEIAEKSVRPVDVAVGILMRPNGDVLLAQRPEGKPYEGYWEFPGGKVEAGEEISAALKREFLEELGITIISARPWCGVEYIYPHAHVRLHFYICPEATKPGRTGICLAGQCWRQPVTTGNPALA